VDSNDKKTSREAFLEAIMSQVSSQSAILAGLAFTAIAAFVRETSTFTWGHAAFLICAFLAMSLEVLAMFISGILLFIAKDVSLDHFREYMALAWFSYLIGVVLFVVSVVVIAWIKFDRAAAIPVTIVCGTAFSVGVLCLLGIAFKRNKGSLK
jgi:hypothetical protein